MLQINERALAPQGRELRLPRYHPVWHGCLRRPAPLSPAPTAPSPQSTQAHPA